MLVLGLVDIPWWGILIAVIVVFLSYTCRDFNYFRKQGIPHAMPLPVIGTMYSMFQKPDENILTPEKSPKGCFGYFLGSSPSLVVFDEELLSEIMVKEFSAFSSRQHILTGTYHDHSIFALTGQHWKRVRNEMTPAFTSGKLKKMNAEFNRCAQNLVDHLLKPAKSGEMVEIKEYAGACTMDAISSVAFGIKLDSQENRNNAFVYHAKKIMDQDFIKSPTLLLRMMLPKLNELLIKLGFPFSFSSGDTETFFRKILTQTIEMRKEDVDQSRNDFLHLMLKAQRGENIQDDDNEDQDANVQVKGLTTDEILGNAVLFLIAGYDTTASTLSFLMYNMALNLDCQARLIEEIDQVVGNKDLVEYSMLQEMPYLDQCINETLRIYPPGVLVNREATRDVTVNGIFIRKGMVITIPIRGIHMDPRKWPEPEKFDPERFSSENKKNRKPYHYMPFGHGPRNCIGMRLALQEVKIAAVHVLKKMKVSKCEKTQVPLEFNKNSPHMLKVDSGIWLKFEQRNEK